MVITVECINGRYTGRYLKGDFSNHFKFNPTMHKVMSLKALNQAIDKQNRQSAIITLDEIYHTPSCRDESYQENLWK